MSKNANFFGATTMLLCLFMLLMSCDGEKKGKGLTDDLADDYVLGSTDEDCPCEAKWFPHSQTPPPEEGKGSPFDVKSTTNCIFHQWAWQKFLWLTKDFNGLPLFLDSDTVMQVSNALVPSPVVQGANIILGDTVQAGFAHAVLLTNPAYNSQNEDFIVHYSIHTNPTMYNAAISFAQQIVGGTLDSTNLSSFPVGSFEMKVSWVDTDAIAASDTSNFFITNAAFPKASGSGYDIKRAAMLGMHIVGVVENHPEFIWATFENKGIAPTYDWPSNHASSEDDILLFGEGVTVGIDGISYDGTTRKGKVPYKVFDLFEYGVPRDSAGIWKNTSQSEPTNFNNIDQLNKCVADSLSSSDIWNNYFYNGGLWINTDSLSSQQQAEAINNAGSNLDSGEKGAIARGSLNNANVTMETFTQTFVSDISQINVASLINCFTCHNAVSMDNQKSPIYLSHIFDNYLANQSQRSAKEIRTLKDNQHRIQTLKKFK